MIDSLGRVNPGGGPRPGSGKALPPAVEKFRKRWRDFYNSPQGDKELLEAQRAEPVVRLGVLRLVMPVPIEPAPAPQPSPPLLILVGQNGGQVALGYSPQGVVPGMEQFMPQEVRTALPPANGGHNGKGKRRSPR